MSENHPNLTVLKQFSTGELDDQLSILISAHISGCKKCAKIVADFESESAHSYFDTVSNNNQQKIPDLSAMQQEILKKTVVPKTTVAPESDKNESLVFKNKTVDLPNPLVSLKKQMGPWKTVNKNISYSKINVQGKGNLYFVYFGKGAKIPEHTHDGNEYAYVVAGSFNDQVSEYISGDFASFDHSDSHHPYTNDPDGCMLLVALEGPFYFKKGLARMLNPFRRFIFKKF